MLLAAAVWAVLPGWAAFSPAGTITFADLNVIASHVATLGQGTRDPLLSTVIPRAIREQGVARLFGPMRAGSPGVAVCYVDAQVVARITASKKATDHDWARAKRWSILYPTTLSQAAFLARRRDARPDRNGTIRVPPGNGTSTTTWACWSQDGKWVALSSSPAIAAHTHRAAAAALKRPLKGDLAVIQMDASGARAVFQTDACAGGTIAVRMAKAGLEIRGTVRAAGRRLPLAPGATSFKRVPAHAPLFGVTSSPDDMRSADIFALAGPEVAAFVRRSLILLQGQGASTYYLNGEAGGQAAVKPQQRVINILPEVFTRPAANVMFCSPATVLRLYLPRLAATLNPLESAKLQLGVRMLRRVRGDGLGFIGWREGADDKFLIRISRDELRGTSALWSSLFL